MVGIVVSSTGGIGALEALLAAMPAHVGLALVVVHRGSADEARELPALLARWTSLEVEIAREGTIDACCEKLAREHGADAIAVVLSGRGSDGVAGAAAIKRAGGVVLAEDPATACAAELPAQVIASGVVDQMLPAAAMAEELVACSSGAYASASITDGRVLDAILERVRALRGVDLGGYKRHPVRSRIRHRMRHRYVARLADYAALLEDDAAEVDTLIRGIPIHATRFFRDRDAWAVLERDVIPRIVGRGDRSVRAWTAACATGEEAFSLAMLLDERDALFQIVATDASHELVAQASRGIYTADAIAVLSPERRERFFYGADGAYRVKRALREKIVFARQDLVTVPPGDLDLVTCRNLMIYLAPEAAARVAYLLCGALRVGGYLMLGEHETVPRQRGLEAVGHRTGIYRKVAELADPRAVATSSRSSRQLAEAYAHRAVVQQHELPAVIVDVHFSIVRIYGDTAPFLRFRPGTPSLDLRNLVPPAIARELELVARTALTQQRSLTMGGDGGGGPDFGVRVTPLESADDGSVQLLVTFLAHAASPAEKTRETAYWSEALRLSREELDAARTELRVVNDELQASNDRLDHANSQLRDKIDALELQTGVLSAGAVMTLFLDRELRVRWFTAAMEALFPVQESDLGRPITDLVPRYGDPDLVAHIHAVVRDRVPYEAEVTRADGRWFLQRIRPHGESGIAMTFADITDIKRGEHVLRESEAWVLGQKEAFQAAMGGAPLATSLGLLVQTAVEYMEGARAAFYLVDDTGKALPRVIGMSEPRDSLASAGLPTNQPVITPDCWSFPIQLASGKVAGTLAMYHQPPRSPTPRDLELAAVLAHAAAIIIER